MPIWAPVGGSPGGLMNGHNTGAWSDVIRQVATGAFAGDHPAPGRRAPARAACLNSRGSFITGAGCGTLGRSWPKSASNRAMSRPPRPFTVRTMSTPPVPGCRILGPVRSSCVALAAQADTKGNGGGGEGRVLAQVQAQRREPCTAYRRVEPAGVLGDPCGLGHGDGAHGIRAGHRVAAGELVVHAVGLGGLGPRLGALLDPSLGAQVCPDVGGPLRVRARPVGFALAQRWERWH